MAVKVEAFRLSGRVEVDNRAAHKNLKATEADAKSVAREFKGLRGEIGHISGKLSSLRVGAGDFISRSASNVLGNLVTGAIQSAVDKTRQLTAEGMAYYDTVQMSKMAFGTLLGDMERGKALTADLLKFSRQTPFDDQPVLKYSQGLLAAKVHAKDLRTYLTGIGNALAASGDFGLEAQQGTVKAIKDILGKPTLMSEDVKGQLSEWVPSAMADWAAALEITQEEFTRRMAAGQIKSRAATRLLIDYWNRQKGGMMQFAGERTFEGLESSKRSSESRAAANAIAGGDVMNPADGSAGQLRIDELKAQIGRRDALATNTQALETLGGIMTAFLRAKDADDAAVFTGIEKGGSFAASFVRSFNRQAQGPGGLPSAVGVGQAAGDAVMGDRPGVLENTPVGAAVRAVDQFEKKIGQLFFGATDTATQAVEAGRPGMFKAGASLGDTLVKGAESPAGLDKRSPPRKMVRLGQEAREAFILGALDPSIDVHGAGATMADQLFAGGRGRLGVSQREQLERAAADPKVKAFFDTIRVAEGGKTPYVMAGRTGRDVNSGAAHPGEVVPRSQWFLGDKGRSSAAGYYQITRTNWRNLAPALGLDNFGDPHQQMIAALKLFADRDGGAGLRALQSGDFETAMRVAAKDWTSTPGSRIGGGGQWAKSRWMGQLQKELAEGGGEQMEPVGVTTSGVPVFAGARVAGSARSRFAGAKVNGSAGELAGQMKFGDWRRQQGFYTDTVDAGNAVGIDPRTMRPYARRAAGPPRVRTITDRAPVIVADTVAAMEPLPKTAGEVSKSFLTVGTELPKAATSTGLGLKLLEEQAAKTAQSVAALDAAERARLRKLALGGGGKTRGLFSGADRYATDKTDDEGNITEQASAAEEAAAGVSATFKDLKAIGKDAFGSLAEGVGGIVENYILLGETGPNAMRKLTAQVLASASKEATVKGIMSMADGFAHLFTNPAQSAADFTAAGIYFSVAAATGFAGRKMAGNLFNGKDGNPAHNAESENERYASESNPDNRFTRRATGGPVYRSRAYLVGDGGRTEVFEPKVDGHVYPSVDAYEQSRRGNMWSRIRSRIDAQGGGEQPALSQTVNQLASAVERLTARIESMSPGDVVRAGAPKAKREIGHAAADSMHSDHDITQKFQRRVAA